MHTFIFFISFNFFQEKVYQNIPRGYQPVDNFHICKLEKNIEKLTCSDFYLTLLAHIVMI
jgi:hypothetical protein